MATGSEWQKEGNQTGRQASLELAEGRHPLTCYESSEGLGPPRGVASNLYLEVVDSLGRDSYRRVPFVNADEGDR